MTSPVQAQNPFAEGVRPTDPLTPEEERKSFQVPDGFEVQLVAAEPDIQKPMNLAFDARGRLWASMSVEYPWAAPLDQPGRDCIKILEDTDGDGRADKITTFADGLNIPIGLYPYKNGVIAWSIPNIWFLEDTDGDDVADKRTILYGPMGYERDTHGMNNAFTRGFDGWLYACHGFNNHTTVKGADGHEITMRSGNTYRMRLHGERVEQFTWGQVNPFGMALDEFGNLFTADCHSKPIYQLVSGGYYPSFGAPHDGLGFVPQMMDHLHGSTAIAGMAIVTGAGFPEELRGDGFVGNVMTSRINRDRLERVGASVCAVEQPDFLSTTDPWYRPVDLQYGPDDALYVADFYNRIIGHYEVPLTHPGRDRTSGRIWRIVYKGKDAAGSEKRLPDFTAMSITELIEQLKSPNLTRRMLVTDRLSDHFGEACIPACRAAWRASDSATVRIHCLWVLHRLGALRFDEARALTQSSDPLLRSHGFRALAESSARPTDLVELATEGLGDENAAVRIAAAEFAGRHPDERSIAAILDSHATSDSADVVLRHALLIALKRHLQWREAFDAPEVSNAQGDRALLLARACLAVPSEASAAFLVDALGRLPEGTLDLNAVLAHIAANCPTSKFREVTAIIRQRTPNDLDFQFQQLVAMEQGFARRSQNRSVALQAWATDLAGEMLASIEGDSSGWLNVPHPGAADATNPWDRQTRPCADGRRADLISSHPHGEQLTGTLRSPAFAAPKSFRFYGCGHRGFPDREELDLNFYRLRDAATGELLHEARPPRNDTARLYEWDLSAIAGRQVVFEIVDGDPGAAYAWLAAGRFDPPVISEPVFLRQREQRQIAALDIVGRYRLEEYLSTLKVVLQDANQSSAVHASAARAYLEMHPDRLLEALAPLVGDAGVESKLRERIRGAVIERDAETQAELLPATFAAIAGRQQVQLALALAGSPEGAGVLLQLVADGKAPGRLLQLQGILQAFKASNLEGWEDRVAELTRNLPSAKIELRELIAERLKQYPTANTSPERGVAIYEKHCKHCHQIAGQGQLVGPQLDGIGNRGLERLLEDVLDPNQNVDVAFHSMVLVLDDGKVVNGLFRREEGNVWVLVDQKGKEFTIPKGSIEESVKSPLSLMPETVARDLTPGEFFDLMKYLLQQTAKPEP